MSFTLPASLAGIAATRQYINDGFDKNYGAAAPNNVALVHAQNKVAKKQAIADYIEKETTED